MGKKLVVFFVALTSLELYDLSFLGTDFIKVFQLLGIGFLVLILAIQLVQQKQINFEKHFNTGLILIFTGVILSMFMAQWGHDQSLGITFIAQRFMYFYLLYWALHAIKIDTDDLESIIYWLGITFSFLYLIQFFLYPAILFDVRIAEDRDTIRIFLPGFTFLVLAYFLTINRLFDEFSFSKIFSVILFLSILILMGTRQVIFTVLLLTMLNILFSERIKSKVFIFTLMVLSIIPIIIIFQGIFISLIDLSKNQSQSLAENVRIRAAGFFLTQLFPNTFSYITGNGADSTNSSYGFMIQMYRDAYGFFQSDIGIIGDYTKFGAVFVIGVFIILYKTIFGKIGGYFVYIKYFYISILLTLFTGGGPFAQSDAIVAICFTLYILDIDKYDQLNSEEETDEESYDEMESTQTEMSDDRFI